MIRPGKKEPLGASQTLAILPTVVIGLAAITVWREMFKTHAMQIMLVGTLELLMDPLGTSIHRAMLLMHAMEQEEIPWQTPSFPIWTIVATLIMHARIQRKPIFRVYVRYE